MKPAGRTNQMSASGTLAEESMTIVSGLMTQPPLL